MTKTETFAEYLDSIGACEEAVEWVGTKTAQEAWDTAERADWLLWLLAKTAERKSVVRIACACARTALKYAKDDELRPLRAIEAAEAWCDGTVDIETVRNAATAAYTAAYAHAAHAHAAYAAAAAAYAYAAAPRRKAHLEMCGIIRSMAACPEIIKGRK